MAPRYSRSEFFKFYFLRFYHLHVHAKSLTEKRYRIVSYEQCISTATINYFVKWTGIVEKNPEFC